MTLAAKSPASDRTLRSGADLADAGLIPASRVAEADAVAATYSLALTPHVAALIDPFDPDDPIARQFVPNARELDPHPRDRNDPIGDAAHAPMKGIVHRHPGRLLLLPTLVCPVYCRFCFRRETVGPAGGVLTENELDRAIRYIAAQEAVSEVILSGGDPLTLSDRRLDRIIGALDEIGHVETIRIHTRVPVADPGRITPELCEVMTRETPVFMVVHCNHAREIAEPVGPALHRLVTAGIPLLSQTVLLKGVNDDAETLSALMKALVRHRVKPYYLHHGDLAPGTAHFRTTIAEGQALMRALRRLVSGPCLPTYVLDIPGGYGKVPIGPEFLSRDESGTLTVDDDEGRRHIYDVEGPR
jgi:lysine 2,3-aminomutase